MTISTRKLFTTLAFMVMGIHLQANIRLPKLVGSHMVLQRDVPAKLWGWAEAGENINIVFNNITLSGIADVEGKWILALPKQPAGGPHTFYIKGKNEIMLDDIYFGEVWLCSGQSNMEWSPSLGINDSLKEVSAANYPLIRFFTVENAMTLIPQEDVKSDGWKICTPETMNKFSATGYFFGRELFKKYNVPIGLISSDCGGSPIETWSTPSALKQLPKYREAMLLQEELASDPKAFEINLKKKTDEWEARIAAMDVGLTSKPNWHSTPYTSPDWKTIEMPSVWEKSELPGFDGIVWLTKVINLPESMIGKDLTLSLAKIDDNDYTYFNGEFIGSTRGYNVDRIYTIPARLLKKVKNTITVRVYDNGGGGGIHGDAALMKLSSAKETIPLSGIWNLRPSINFKDMPPYPFTTGSFWQNCGVYNGMIAPITNYNIKGVIWYQGESNVKNPEEYQILFPSLINDWRTIRKAYDLPFIYVQLANLEAVKIHPVHDAEWMYLREAQLKTLNLVTNTGMVVATDIGDSLDIHPRNKQDVGKRLALQAEKLAYKENIVAVGPLFSAAEFSDKTITIRFTSVGKGLIAKNNSAISGFEACGSDKKFTKVKAEIKGDIILIEQNPSVKYSAVRYNWANNPKGNLYNKEGLPASPFRTYSW